MPMQLTLPRSPVSEEPPRSSILNVAKVIEGEDWVDHGFEMANHPAGHLNIESTSAVAAPGQPNSVFNECTSTRFFPFTLDWRTEIKGLSGGTEAAKATSEKLARHALEADTPYGVSRALQFGTTNAYGTNPGLSTLPSGIGVGEVNTITAAGREAVASGAALALVPGIASLLDWWQDLGLPGMAVVHMPSQLAVHASRDRLIEPGQQGAPLLAGGMAWLSFGPGYDPTIGPGGQVAPAGATWIWVTSEVHVGLTGITTEDFSKFRRNESAVKASRRCVYGFNTSTVAAALVSIG